MIEFFKDIGNYEGLYQISSSGRVRSLSRVDIKGRRVSDKFLSYSSRNGYYRVNLSKNGISKKYSVHRLVAEAFLVKFNDELEVNHKDGIKINNEVDNLEWVTRSDNCIHKIKILKKGIGENNGSSKLRDKDIIDIKRMLRESLMNQGKIGSLFNVSRETINRISNNRTRRI